MQGTTLEMRSGGDDAQSITGRLSLMKSSLTCSLIGTFACFDILVYDSKVCAKSVIILA